MNRVLLGVAGLGWVFVVFVLGLYLTFPEDAAVQRARWEVQSQSEGAMALQLGGLSPWWLGASGSDIELFSVDDKARREEDKVQRLFSAEHARVRVGLLSLIMGGPRAIGAVGIGTGEVTFDAAVQQNDRGRWLPYDVTVDADEFPLNGLPPIGGAQVDATGALNLALRLEAPDGIRKSNGSASLRGENLLINNIAFPPGGMMDELDIPIPIEELDLTWEITEGRARVTSGRIISELLEAEISGEVVLLANVGKSRLRMKVVITKIGGALAPFQGFLKDAAHKDGTWHYRLNGTFNAPRFMPDKERTSARSTRSRATQPTTAGSSGAEEEAELRKERREQRRRRAREQAAARADKNRNSPRRERPVDVRSPLQRGMGTRPVVRNPTAGDDMDDDTDDMGDDTDDMDTDDMGDDTDDMGDDTDVAGGDY